MDIVKILPNVEPWEINELYEFSVTFSAPKSSKLVKNFQRYVLR